MAKTHKLSVSQKNGRYTGYCSCGAVLGKTAVLLEVGKKFDQHKKGGK